MCTFIHHTPSSPPWTQASSQAGNTARTAKQLCNEWVNKNKRWLRSRCPLRCCRLHCLLACCYVAVSVAVAVIAFAAATAVVYFPCTSPQEGGRQHFIKAHARENKTTRITSTTTITTITVATATSTTTIGNAFYKHKQTERRRNLMERGSTDISNEWKRDKQQGKAGQRY